MYYCNHFLLSFPYLSFLSSVYAEMPYIHFIFNLKIHFQDSGSQELMLANCFCCRIIWLVSGFCCHSATGRPSVEVSVIDWPYSMSLLVETQWVGSAPFGLDIYFWSVCFWPGFSSWLSDITEVFSGEGFYGSGCHFESMSIIAFICSFAFME